MSVADAAARRAADGNTDGRDAPGDLLAAGDLRARPDVAIVGAMKCGTSSLAAQLAAQPGLFVTTPKEPNFFSDDDVYARGPDWYAGLFDGAAPGDLRVEASTHYAKLPDLPRACPRLAAACPDARIVYLIRDPVARAVSHFVHGWTVGEMGRDGETIDDAVEARPALIAYGRYGAQVAPWLAAFGPDRVHVDTMEAMRADPRAFMDRLGAFLGRPLAWRDDLGAQNVSAERLRRHPLDRWLLHSAPAEALRRALVPKALREAVKARRRMTDRPVLGAAARARLEAAFLEDRARLHDLLPGRPDLDAAYPFVTA